MKKLNRKHRYMILTIAIGIIVSVIVTIDEKKNDIVHDKSVLYRNEWNEGDYVANLTYSIDEIQNSIDVSIDARELSDSELDALALEASSMIEKMMLNGNEDVHHITSNLQFPLSIAGYPFDIRWKSYDEDTIDQTGKIKLDEGYKESIDVLLKASLIYENYSKSLNYEVRVIPKNYCADEVTRMQIDKNVREAVNKSPNEKKIELPQYYGNSRIVYMSKSNRMGVLILLASILLSVLIGVAVDYDSQRKRKNEEEKLSIVYPEFVQNLKLYLVSGLTVKASIAEIYKNYKSYNNPKYENLLYILAGCINEYRNGVSEDKVLTKLGNRCSGEYRKLMYLLCVNLRKGNDRIIDLLEEETAKALSFRKDNAKRRGDEASVKMLFPMMLMLLIVMALIMVPVYFSL